MDNLARQLPQQAANLVYGRILAQGETFMRVASDGGTLDCERADGCLLRPEAGDLVLVATAAPGLGYVLAVIKRANRAKHPARLDVAGDLQISAGGGDLTLAADRDLALVAAGQASLLGSTLSATAEVAQLNAGKISVAARLFTGSYKAVSLAAGTVEHVFARLTQKLRNSLRLVDEHDEVVAATKRLAVEEDYAVQSKNEVHMAEDVVKIDAGEVHLG